MSLSWIRVNASLLDDDEVRRFGAELFPRLDPWMARGAGAGLLVALWGRVAEHQPDGRVDHRDDEQLEEWAQWKGRPGVFAKAFRKRFVGDDGVILLWDEYQGAALDRREKDRVRKEKERKEKERMSRGESADGRADSPAERPRDIPKTSGVNGTVTGTALKKAGSSTAHRSQRGRSDSTAPVEKPAPLSSREDLNSDQPDSALKLRDVVSPKAPIETSEPEDFELPELPAPGESIDDENDKLPAAAHNLLHAFYRKAKPERYADVLSQLDRSLTEVGVTFEGNTVRAVDREHLAWACDQTIRSGIRDFDVAIVFVLKKLRDTRLEVLSQRYKADEARPLQTQET